MLIENERGVYSIGGMLPRGGSMKERILGIKEEVAQLFAGNGIENGWIHSTYKIYMEGEKGHTPYVDSRVRFKGIRKLKNLMKEFGGLDNEITYKRN